MDLSDTPNNLLNGVKKDLSVLQTNLEKVASWLDRPYTEDGGYSDKNIQSRIDEVEYFLRKLLKRKNPVIG